MERKTTFSTSRSGSVVNSRSNSRMGGGSIMTNSTSKFSLSRGSRSFFGSKGNLYSGSQRGLHSESQVKNSAGLIFNDKGEDVTPRPLIKTEQQSVPIRRNQSDLGIPTDSTLGGQQSLFASGNASFMQPFRSVFGGGSAMESGSTAGTGTSSSMMGSFMGSVTDEIPGTKTSSRPPTRTESIQDVEEVLTPEDLEKMVDIQLNETDTIWLLDIPSTWVAPDSEDAESVQQQNAVYHELCKSRPGNDRYTERGMQTFNEAPKSKHVQTEQVVKREVEVFASDWEMYNMLDSDKLKETPSHGSSQITSRVVSASTTLHSRPPTEMSMGMSVMGSVAGPGESSIFSVTVTPNVTVYSNKGYSLGSTQEGEVKEEEKFDPTRPNDHPILKLDSLKDNLRIAERAVTQNIFQQKQAKYRDLPVLSDPDNPLSALDTFTISTPHLEKLWGFKCPLTQGRPITCIAWNPTNKDIVAVGYGQFNMIEQNPGLVCCWSLKNPQYPERILYAPAGVTSLSFSCHHPNLLAVGLYNGSLVLYNCRSTAHEPALTSRDALFKHAGPIWQIEWIVKERSFGEDKAEVLVSIGVDGRVLQWTIRKGFESMQLMRLKRMLQSKTIEKKLSPSKSKLIQQQKQKKLKQKQNQADMPHVEQEAYISHHAPGMGFAFWLSDTNIYLTCTEEGYIHKCSCSYNEQFLETYTGHTGPVYRVLWHPLNKDLFLSCSSDWSIRLWHQDRQTPLHIFQVTQKQEPPKETRTSRRRATEEKQTDQSSQEAVWAIDWCPHDSTVFACVRGGRIEIWNLKQNVLDPVIVHKPVSGTRQTYLQFSRNSDIILVGDALGEVSVYLPKNLPSRPRNKIEALNEALDALQNPTKR